MDFSTFNVFDATMQLKDFFYSSSTKFTLQSGNLMEEWKPMEIGENEFEYRYKSELLAPCCLFRITSSDSKIEVHVFYRMIFHKPNILNWCFDRVSQTFCWGEKFVRV